MRIWDKAVDYVTLRKDVEGLKRTVAHLVSLEATRAEKASRRLKVAPSSTTKKTKKKP